MVQKLVENSSMYNLFHQAYIHPINTSKLFAGILMIIMNIGSKYFEIGLILSIIMTAAFVILSAHIFNEKSRFCVISKHLKKISKLMDINDDGVISLEEEKQAMAVLEKVKKMRKKKQQGEFISYMDKYSAQTFEDQTFSDQFYM